MSLTTTITTKSKFHLQQLFNFVSNIKIEIKFPQFFNIVNKQDCFFLESVILTSLLFCIVVFYLQCVLI